MKVIFKRLEPSELAKEIATNQISEILNKFTVVEQQKVTLTLSMDNSSQQPGRDLFGAKIMLRGEKYGDILLEKQATSLYEAVGSLREALLERMNRVNDRKRVKTRSKLRLIKQKLVETLYEK